MTQEKFVPDFEPEKGDYEIRPRTLQEAFRALKEEKDVLDALAFLVESGDLVVQDIIDRRSGREMGYQIVDPLTGKILLYESAGLSGIMEKYEERLRPQEH